MMHLSCLNLTFVPPCQDADGPSPQGFTQPQMDNEEGPTVAVHGEPA